ncbi:WD40/YVTN/BNR-like repeat-containing protein [Streptomyces sp. C1-1]|uniref:WD40/YVTN/BNR-like repeat-containing protein n=1 Tax=Streptomyces sp. C1-1 TaxID=3231173 RepID=UPI003D0863C1
MRGPNDPEPHEPQEAEGVTAEGGSTGRSGRPPGGKALARLVQELTRAGLGEHAAAQVALAAPELDADGTNALIERAVGPQTAPTAEPGGVAAEYQQTAEALAGPAAVGPAWRSLGPWTVPGGQTYGASRVNVSGRVSAIATDPGNAAHLLVGAANGGVWESYDRGTSWAPRTDDAATLTVGALAYDPANPSTVLAGTGEGNWWSWLGTGVLRSTDGGTKWSPLATTPFVGQGFYDLAFDASRPGTVHAATTGGLYVSTDGGATWTRRRSTRTWSLSVVAGEALAACQDGLFRSADGGTTWTAVTLPGAPASFDRLATAIARSDSSIAYAWGASGTTARLWRRAGGTWSAVTPPAGASTGQAWYDWFLAVAPDQAGRIYLGAIEAYRGDLSGSTWTWQTISNKGATGDSIHPDQHAIAFESGSPDAIYVGNDGGLFRSPDRGVTWQHLNNGLTITEFEYLAQDFGSSRWVIGGTQDNGTNRWTGSSVWTHSQDGDGGDVAVYRTDPRTVFHTFFGMSPERSLSRGDPGTWTNQSPTLPSGEGSLFYPPLETSATNGTTVALGGGALYVSRDNAATWTRLAFPSAATASAMYIPHADQVLVGTTDGRIFRTTWSGAAWGTLTALTTPRASAWISDIHVDPVDTNRLWVTHTSLGGGRIWQSTDGGSNWTDRSTTGLPSLPLNAVEVDPRNRSRLWVAADLGVYQSTDGGASWQQFGTGLPNAFIGDIILHPHARVLRAGTRNRGVWEVPVDGWMTQPVCGTQWTGTLAAGATMRWFTFNWPATWHVLWTVMPTTVHPGAPQVSWTTQVERASNEYVTYWITVRNLTQEPVSFEGRYEILSRY